MSLTGKTARALCVRAGIARTEITEEAQKIFELSQDPNISPEQKEKVKKELDEIIADLQAKVETRKRTAFARGA
jgi:hypothetical protein